MFLKAAISVRKKLIRFKKMIIFFLFFFSFWPKKEKPKPKIFGFGTKILV